MGGSLTRGCAALAAIAVVTGATGCGAKRQDADEPKGSFRVEVSDVSFPRNQQVSQTSTMRIRVRNADSKEIPNIAMTVETQAKTPGGAPSSFGQAVDDPRLADNERPIWIVDRGPAGGDSAYTNTWALGRLKSGQSRTFEWRVTAIKPGRYTIDYEASPGLDGKARVAAGSKASGTLRVRINGEPVDARVADDGSVERDR